MLPPVLGTARTGGTTPTPPTELEATIDNCPATAKVESDTSPWTTGLVSALIVFLATAGPVSIYALYAYGSLGLLKQHIGPVMGGMIAAGTIVSIGAGGALFRNVSPYYEKDAVTFGCAKLSEDDAKKALLLPPTPPPPPPPAARA
jgi:hypothetical protein